MPDRPPPPQERFAQLRHAYLARLPALLAEIEALAGRAPAPEALDGLYRHLHKLAGSGGTYGFPELSERASALEARVRAWIEGGTFRPGSHDELAEDLARLREAVACATDAQA